MKQRANLGFTLVEMVVVAGILGIVGVAFSHFMNSIGTAHKSQSDLETRVDLFQTLNQLQRLVDCNATQASAPTTIPAEGAPIALIGGKGETVISEYGTKKGKFSYIADIFPDTSIKVRAAAFKEQGALPRNRLNASNSEFITKKVSLEPWSWNVSSSLIERDFAALGSFCGGSSSTAGAAGAAGLATQCTVGSTRGGLSGFEIIATISCIVVETNSGRICSAGAVPLDDDHTYIDNNRRYPIKGVEDWNSYVNQSQVFTGNEGAVSNGTARIGDIKATSSNHDQPIDPSFSKHPGVERCIKYLQAKKIF